MCIYKKKLFEKKNRKLTSNKSPTFPLIPNFDTEIEHRVKRDHVKLNITSDRAMIEGEELMKKKRKRKKRKNERMDGSFVAIRITGFDINGKKLKISESLISSLDPFVYKML